MASLGVGIAIAGIWIGAGILGKGNDGPYYVAAWAAGATCAVAFFGFAAATIIN